MYINLKPNHRKRISFNTTTMTSLGFIDPPPEIFRSPPTMGVHFLCLVSNCYWQLLAASHKSIILKELRKEF